MLRSKRLTQYPYSQGQGKGGSEKSSKMDTDLQTDTTQTDKIKLCADAVPWKISTTKIEPPKFAVHA